MVLEFEEALVEVMRQALSLRSRRTPDVETIPLLQSAGRVLAQPILADRDQPPFDRATRDGYAVRAGEWSSGQALKVLGQVRAGEAWQGEPLHAREAVEIMTGAPVPAGANSVAMLEHAQTSGLSVRASAGRTLMAGENVVPRGSEARQGQANVAAGSLAGAAEIALAATCGCVKLTIFARPTVSIVATGDELVELDQVPDDRQIRNSNSYGLAALVAAAGGLPDRLEIARDVREELRDRIIRGRKVALMLLSGGVSMGKYDLVEEVLAEFGAEFYFTGVMMQPGKPLVFGRLPERDGVPECFFFGLPGNPVSTQVTFHCFVEPFLRVLAGEQVSGPRFAQATLSEDVPGRPGLMRLLPARLETDVRDARVRLVAWQGSGDLAANARANCYAVLPPERTEFRKGEVISVLLR